MTAQKFYKFVLYLLVFIHYFITGFAIYFELQRPTFELTAGAIVIVLYTFFHGTALLVIAMNLKLSSRTKYRSLINNTPRGSFHHE